MAVRVRNKKVKKVKVEKRCPYCYGCGFKSLYYYKTDIKGIDYEICGMCYGMGKVVVTIPQDCINNV